MFSFKALKTKSASAGLTLVSVSVLLEVMHRDYSNCRKKKTGHSNKVLRSRLRGTQKLNKFNLKYVIYLSNNKLRIELKMAIPKAGYVIRGR